MSRETKTLHFQVKATGITVNAKGQEVGEIEAFTAMYGNVDEGNDRVVAGASKRTVINSKARAKSRNKDYILPMIWNHDMEHFLPLGGWYDVDGDNPEGLLGKAHVLLSTQTGREYYELAKAGMIDTFSVIYDIPTGGARYDKAGVREITEWRIHSMDPVIFPMNDETRLIAVKSAQKDKPVNPKTKPKQLKTLMEHYNETQAEDLLEDWQDVFVCSLTCAIMDAFTIGDEPASDISDALDVFKELVMSKFVAQAIECDLSQHIADSSYAYNPAASTLQNGSDDSYGYGYMSRSDRNQQRKAGRAISAATQSVIDDHVKSVKAMAKQAKSDMQAHTDSMHDAVDSMSGDGGKSLGTLASHKAGRSLSTTNADALHDMADKAMSIMQEHTKGLTKAANGLAQAVKPPVSDTDGEDPTDDNDQIEKGLQDALRELKALPLQAV